jgi:hypothetical protein
LNDKTNTDTGDTCIAAKISLTVAWGFGIPLTYTLTFIAELGLTGIWLGQFIMIVVRNTVLVTIVRMLLLFLTTCTAPSPSLFFLTFCLSHSHWVSDGSHVVNVVPITYGNVMLRCIRYRRFGKIGTRSLGKPSERWRPHVRAWKKNEGSHQTGKKTTTILMTMRRPERQRRIRFTSLLAKVIMAMQMIQFQSPQAGKLVHSHYATNL